jgi:acetolactate synthase-1/2/3 large subunit
MIKLSDYVMKFIAGQGVKNVFMLSGGGCMHLVDSIGRNNELNFTCCLHEQVAAFAATAYSQYTNNLGVALVTTGPGGTNAITGVAAAWSDSIPILVISGQVKRDDIAGQKGLRTLGFQEIDIVSVVKPLTKYAVTVLVPGEIKYHLQKAVHLAKTGRPGPVWIDIPLDVQASMIDENKLSEFGHSLYHDDANTPGDTKNIDSIINRVVELINNSKRPVILAGYGIKISKSEKSFLSLIEKLGIPVLTTWKALDLLPQEHELFFGRPGCIGQRGANFIQQNSDLIISIGARLDFGQIGYSHETFARAAKKIIVDVDPAELKKFKFNTDIEVNSCAGIFISELLNQAGNLKSVDRTEWISKCRYWKMKYPVLLDEHKSKEDYASTYVLVDALSDLASGDSLFVPENSGAASEIVMQSLRLKEGQRVITTNTLGAMGSGLPASIGACIAGDNKPTICVIGDGGFQMNIQDLETVRRLNLPIKYFILNNDGYGSIKNMQRNYFKSKYVASNPESGVTLPASEKIAASYTIKYLIIKTNRDVEEKVKETLNYAGPVICEVLVDPSEPTMPKLTSEVRPDGSMISKPLEDLWPFLSREEFLANMLISPLKE